MSDCGVEMKNKNMKKGTALWIDESGAIRTRIFNVISVDKEFIVIAFSKEEKYKIKRAYMRGSRVIIYKKSDGKIVVQNPNKISQMDLKAQNIKVLRFNLQNSALQESKAAIHRWTSPKDMVDKLGPIFKLMFICIAVGVIGWAAFNFSTYALEIISRSRLMECSTLFPNAPSPVGYVANLTSPVGT